MQYFAWCNLTCPHAPSRVFSALTMGNTNVHVNDAPHPHLLKFHTVPPFQQLSLHHFFVQSFLRYHHHLNCFHSIFGATKFFSQLNQIFISIMTFISFRSIFSSHLLGLPWLYFFISSISVISTMLLLRT